MLRRSGLVVGILSLAASASPVFAQPAAPPGATPSAAAPAGSAAPIAAAQPPPVTRDGSEPVVVLMVDTTTAFDQAEALSIVLRREVDATPGYVVTNQPLALGVLRTTMGCPKPIDAACEARIATELSAKRIVWAELELTDRDVAGTLHLYEEGKPPRSVPLHYAANLKEPADETLVDIARKALVAVGAGPAGGHLVVSAPGIDGDVFVGEQKVGVLAGGKGRFDVPSGSHRLVVRRADGVELASDIVVAPWKDTSVSLTAPPPEGPGIDAKIFIGFGAIGLGAGFGIAGLYSSLKVNSNQSEFDETFKDRFPSSVDACEHPGGDESVQRLCDNSDKHVVMQAVFYPIAGVAAAAGATLLALSDWGGGGGAETGLTVVPVIGPTDAGLVVGSRF